MRHFSRSFAALACLAASACTDQSTTIYITDIVLPEEEDGLCVPSDTSVSLSSWNPDVGAYVQYITVVNAVRANASDISNDPSIVYMEGIEVTITDVDGNEIVPAYSVPVAGSIPSATSATSFGSATFGAVIIPSGVASAVASTSFVVVTIVPFGTTLGGLEVEGPPFSLPVSIVPGFSCTVCPDDASPVDVCSPGQDGACTVLPESDPTCADA